MRVGLILEQALSRVPGGAGRYSTELAAALAASQAPDDELCSWVACHRVVTRARVTGVAGPRRLPVPARLLARAWQRGWPPRLGGVDVVHAPTPLFPPASAPIVVSVHDAVAWTHPETLTPRGVAWHRAMIERAARQAAAVAVLTHAVADELSRAVPELAADKIVLLGAGVSPRLLRPPSAEESAEVASRLGLPERYLLSLATLEPRKGLDVLIGALGRLGTSAPPLVVVGQPGWGDVDVASLATRAGLPDRAVTILGRLPDPDLAVALRSAAALVMPSRAEGFGLPIAEAAAVGTPVICSDVPALVEVCDGAAVVVARGDDVALAEAIEAVWTDSALAADLAKRGLVASRRHTWEAVARRAWACYRGLAG